MITEDGVKPPIYKALINSTLFPPNYYIILESCGQTDIIYTNIFPLIVYI